MSYFKTPDRVDMTAAQAKRLRALAEEAYQPRQYEEGLSRSEAERRIAALRSEIELENPF